MLTYYDFDHTKLIGLPFSIVPTENIKIRIMNLPSSSYSKNVEPVVNADDVVVIFNYNAANGLLNEDNYWIYGVVVEASGRTRGDKGVTTKSIVGKIFYSLPGTHTYSYLAKGDIEPHVQYGHLLDGTTFRCDSAVVRLIKFNKQLINN